MGQITVIFTKRVWNPVSFLIRFCIPRSRFSLALASHCMIEDGDYVIEATMLHGTHRVLKTEALKGSKVVETIKYNVPDAEAGLGYARSQAGKPYDFKGAFGLALSPYRDWAEPDCWFCFELAAATLDQAGRHSFANNGHITDSILMALKP